MDAREYDEYHRFDIRRTTLEPARWETHYAYMPVYSITGQLLYQQDVYKRMRHIGNLNLGWEYATLFEIVAL